jgi:transcriptional regulator with XRE-family HTH domain
MSLAEHVFYLRTRKLFLTQEELARELGLASMTVSRWERGVTEPNLKNLRTMAAMAGLSPTWFFDGVA